VTEVKATSRYTHSKTSKCIAELLNFRGLLIKTHSINIGIVLALQFASELSRYCSSICVFIPKELEHLFATMLHTTQLCESQSVCPLIVTDITTDRDTLQRCKCAIFLQWRDHFIDIDYGMARSLSRIIIIAVGKVSKANILLKSRMYERVAVRNIDGNRYLIRFSDKVCFVVVDQGIIRDMDIPHDVMRAYSILRNYFIEFGALRIRDAVNALSKELMIDKAKAREILQNLAKLHLINVRSGYVEVSMESIPLHEDQERDISYKT